MHCLPADISGVSCARGEVQDRVFERYRIETYQEAGYKPYIIAAMILAAQFADPASVLEGIARRRECRIRMLIVCKGIAARADESRHL